MISGYDEGTEVKWNEENTLTRGVVVEVLRESGKIELDGNIISFEVNGNTPLYLVQHHTGKFLILPHSKVMLAHSNSHT